MGAEWCWSISGDRCNRDIQVEYGVLLEGRGQTNNDASLLWKGNQKALGPWVCCPDTISFRRGLLQLERTSGDVILLLGTGCIQKASSAVIMEEIWSRVESRP